MSSEIIEKIERDVMAHKVFERWIGRLALASLLVAIVFGVLIGIEIPTGLFLGDEQLIKLCAVLFFLAASSVGVFHKRISLLGRTVSALLLIASLTYWKAILASSPTQEFSSLSTVHSLSHDLPCFLAALLASAVIMVFTLVLHRRLNLVPSYRVRILSGCIAAACGLIAQGIFCPFISLEHLNLSHLSQALAILAVVFWFDQKLSHQHTLQV